jgi:hypothetical protein
VQAQLKGIVAERAAVAICTVARLQEHNTSANVGRNFIF